MSLRESAGVCGSLLVVCESLREFATQSRPLLFCVFARESSAQGYMHLFVCFTLICLHGRLLTRNGIELDADSTGEAVGGKKKQQTEEQEWWLKSPTGRLFVLGEPDEHNKPSRPTVRQMG